MMKIYIFLLLLNSSFTFGRNVIQTTKVNLDVTPGIVSLKNVTLTVESTICMEVLINQFYQSSSVQDNNGITHPTQVIFASEGYGTLMTVPAFDCNEYYPQCEDEFKLMLGDHWDYGKVFLVFQRITKNTLVIPGLNPGTLTKICLTRNASNLVVYFNGVKVAETTDLTLTGGDKTNINIMNHYSLSMPMDGEMSDFNIWNKTLTMKEINDWYNCERLKHGNTLKWSEVVDSAKNNCNVLYYYFILIC